MQKEKEIDMSEELFFPMSNAIRQAYRRGEEEEGLEPLCLIDKDNRPVGRIKNGDYVIFYDIRGEREIELTRAFTEPGFDRFKTGDAIKTHWVTMIEYHPSLQADVAFPPVGEIKETLSEVLSRANLKQIKIAESEKSTHITFFLNGKRNEPFKGEEWSIIPSPDDVSNFDQCPEMKCKDVTKEVLKAISDTEKDFICANLANIDVVGHIENKDAIITAIETVDSHVGEIVKEAKGAGLFTILVADHGTVEKWYYPDGKIDTGHTDSPVPFILIPPSSYSGIKLVDTERASLKDVAPTILNLFNLEVPSSMTGKSLIESGCLYHKGTRVLLLIMDGWGYNPSSEGNLIHAANTKEVDSLMDKYPWIILAASGEAVGLPKGTVGNSESGHLHLGAGRVILSDRVRIAKAIETGEFYKNSNLLWTIKKAKEDDVNLHLLGIVSFYSSHGSIDYLYALLKMAKDAGMKRVFIHSLLGRRGERPESGAYYVRQIEEKANSMGTGKVVSVIGRYWALDREHNWDRIEKTYNLLVRGAGRGVVS